MPGRREDWFPARLPHGVEPNLSEADRVAVSFNVGLAWKAAPGG